MPVPYRKLVRDRIPEIIAAEGRHPVTRILDQADYRQALLDKLAEEAAEAAHASAGGLVWGWTRRAVRRRACRAAAIAQSARVGYGQAGCTAEALAWQAAAATGAVGCAAVLVRGGSGSARPVSVFPRLGAAGGAGNSSGRTRGSRSAR